MCFLLNFSELFSVNQKHAESIDSLYILNERATYFGKWEHGLFSYCAVGATNVGSIIFYNDTELITNAE